MPSKGGYPTNQGGILRLAQGTDIKVYTNCTIMVPLMGKSCFIDSFCLKIMRWNKA